MEDIKAVFSASLWTLSGLNKQAEAVSCYRTDGCLRCQIQSMMYLVHSEMEIKRCNLDPQRHWKEGDKSGCEQGYIQCSLCYSSRQVNQANPLFSCKTWKLSFNQWEVKEAPWQPIKKQETQCCSGCELPQKLFQPGAFVVLPSSSYLLFILFLCLHSI